MKRDLKAVVIIGVLLVAGAMALAGCGGGGGGGGAGTPGGGTPDAPTAFDLTSPTTGTTGIALSSPTFTWTSSSGETSYALQISTSATFTSIVYAQSGISAAATSVTLAAPPAGPQLAVNTTYYWRIRASNTGGTTNSTSVFSFTTKKSGDSVWSAAGASLGTGFDSIYGMAKDANALYAVGYDTALGRSQWRIEKRNIADGALVAMTGYPGGIITGVTTTQSVANAIAIGQNSMYVVGYEYDADLGYKEWRIEKRGLSTGTTATILRSGTSDGDAIAYAIATDATNSYMYIAGYDSLPGGDHEWRIEKRDMSSGETVTVINRHVGIGDDEAYGIAVDAAAVYVVGFDTADGASTASWKMEKFDISTWATLTVIRSEVDPYGFDAVPYAIKIDSNSMYIAGYDSVSSDGTTTNLYYRWRIEKRGLDGAPDASFGTSGAVTTNLSASLNDAIPNALVIDTDTIYAAGFESTSGGSAEQWRIEKRNISTGALVSGFGTSGVVNLSPSDEAWAIVGDTDYLYAAGDHWRYEKLIK